MSFTLIDLGSENFEFSANVWNWKAALEVIKSLDIIGEGAVRQMTYNATGVKIPLEEAHDLGTRIRKEILPKLVPNKRIFADLSITDAPDDKTLYRDDDEQWKNYSVSHDWLAEFADFCLKSKGFQVF
ncbi:MAG TPA: hypothetical protein VHQ01_00080 [Pyrinomonadaceae bacterium]|jgi:hypothetical protein|nr:hypothetical protein [Pyrinomonadaceae bacterium]